MGEYCHERLHSFVFSDDDDVSSEFVDWMSDIDVVKNRPTEYSSWIEEFGGDRQALRERNNVRKVR